jgi:hypothetical protein
MRVKGRFWGFCVAMLLAPAALCAVPATSSTATHLPLINSSDVPPQSTGFGNSHAVHRQGSHADDPAVVGPVCDTQTPVAISPVPYNVRAAADLQAPPMKPGMGARGNTDGSSDAVTALGDGVQRTLSARSAVLDGGRSASDQSPAAGSDSNQVLGLKVRALSDDERSVYGVADGGLIVTAVGLGAAQHAGFRQGDVVLMLDGISLTSAAQFYKLTRQLPHDRPVPVLVHRPTSNLFLSLGSTRR